VWFFKPPGATVAPNWTFCEAIKEEGLEVGNRRKEQKKTWS
jgi:hypothetical protein